MFLGFMFVVAQTFSGIEDAVGESYEDFCNFNYNPIIYVPDCENPDWQCIKQAEATYLNAVDAAYGMGCSSLASLESLANSYQQIILDSYLNCINGETDPVVCFDNLKKDIEVAKFDIKEGYNKILREVNKEIEAARVAFEETVAGCCN